MSQSCNLFSEGSRKRHPRTLGFDDLIHNLQCPGIAFDILLRESVALAFEGRGAEGVKLNLGIDVLCNGFDSACQGALRQPVGPLWPARCDCLLLCLNLRERFLPCL
jgi:hypothetical protein